MMRHTLLACVLAAMIATPAAAAETRDAKACKAMQATLVPRQAEIGELTATRDASAERVETFGVAWEDVEIHRLVSKTHADAADSAKADYETARAKLARDELALQDAVKQFNADISMFNARCSTKG